MDRGKRLLRIYETLERFFGDLQWWPGESAFEVAVGAILTQNTNWANVEKAIGQLKAQGVMEPRALHGLDDETLANLIRPSGYFRVKTKRLKSFLEVLCGDFRGDLGADALGGHAAGAAEAPGNIGDRGGNRRQHAPLCGGQAGVRRRCLHKANPHKAWDHRWESCPMGRSSACS